MVASPPTFATVEEERQHGLELTGSRMSGVRPVGLLGRVVGSHNRCRDPEQCNTASWINPVGVSFRQMRVSHLVQATHDGAASAGKYGTINPVGFRLHAAVHAARPRSQRGVPCAFGRTARRGRVWVGV